MVSRRRLEGLSRTRAAIAAFITIFVLILVCDGCLAADATASPPTSNGTPTYPAGATTPETFPGGMTTPPPLRGPLPPGGTQEMQTPPVIPSRPAPAALEAKQKLDDIVEETIKSTGALFQTPEKMIVNAPLLTALIRLDERLPSPYELDATASRQVSLRDIETTALTNNLVIKIVGQQMQEKRWTYIGSVGNFLPNLINEMTLQGLSGQYVSPAGAAIPIHNYYLNMPGSFQWYVYKGGQILHTFLEDKHSYKASQFALKGSTNDVLMEAGRLYYKLVENDALLQIRIKGVETSNALYLINQDLYANGANTLLDVMQAKTQLSKDRQHLIKQQVERRQSAVKLATAVNLDTATDMTLSDRQLRKITLIDKSLTIGDLLKIAIDNRPELKKYKEERLAAKEAIKVALAPLLPQVSVTGASVGTFARIPRSTNTAAQPPLGTSGGANVGAVNGGSGLPLANSSTGTTTSTGRAGAGRSLFYIGLDVQWNINGMGLTTYGSVQTAKAKARRIQFEFLDELNRVQKEVRDSYLSSLSAENLIIETTDACNSAAEQLRVAKDRLENGVGTNLDVVTAQRDYTNALIDKAKALTEYNTVQIELLRNIGRITVDTVTASHPLRQ